MFPKLIGTVLSYFRIGLTGPRLKNSSGTLEIKNSDDSSYASLVASQVKTTGENIVLNSDAAGSGADWTTTIARPTSGQTANLTFTLPPTVGTNGQVLQTDGSGNLSFTSAGGSNATSNKIDTTTIAFGSTSPVSMFTTGANDIITKIQVIIDVAFNGTPSLSIGIPGTTSKYMAATELSLTEAAGTVFEVIPGKTAQGAESLIATYSAGSASAGSARILTYYATPD
jgi:hypothetical protein